MKDQVASSASAYFIVASILCNLLQPNAFTCLRMASRRTVLVANRKPRARNRVRLCILALSATAMVASCPSSFQIFIT